MVHRQHPHDTATTWRRFAVPVLGLAAGGMVAASVVGGVVTPAQAQTSGTTDPFERTVTKVHDRTQAEDDAFPESERHGAPYARIETIMRVHYLAEGDDDARRQGPPYASVTRTQVKTYVQEPVRRLEPTQVAVTNTRLVTRFRPGYHEHYKQWHTNRFYNVNQSPQWQQRGCWEWEYSAGTGTCGTDQDPYFGGRYYQWIEHWNDWVALERDYHSTPTHLRDVDPIHPNDCSYNGRKIQYFPGWYQSGEGAKTPMCGWEQVTETYTTYETQNRWVDGYETRVVYVDGDPVTTPVAFETQVRIPGLSQQTITIDRQPS